MPSTSLKRIALICLALATFSASAAAFAEKPFEMSAFKAAQSAGKPLLVDVYASWCPVCRAQQKVLADLQKDPKYDAVTLFRIDYDNQADALAAFSVQRQSTLIAFSGDKETGRSVGDTNAASIAALFDASLK